MKKGRGMRRRAGLGVAARRGVNRRCGSDSDNSDSGGSDSDEAQGIVPSMRGRLRGGGRPAGLRGRAQLFGEGGVRGMFGSDGDDDEHVEAVVDRRRSPPLLRSFSAVATLSSQSGSMGRGGLFGGEPGPQADLESGWAVPEAAGAGTDAGARISMRLPAPILLDGVVDEGRDDEVLHAAGGMRGGTAAALDAAVSSSGRPRRAASDEPGTGLAESRPVELGSAPRAQTSTAADSHRRRHFPGSRSMALGGLAQLQEDM